jgi:hypothetical protein
MAHIEIDLFQRKEDTGFVRPLSTDGRIFYLDPSPWLHPEEPGYEPIRFVADKCDPPLAGDLIQVSVYDEVEEILPISNTVFAQRKITKFINKWARIDPNTIAKRKATLHPEEILWYCTLPFVHQQDIIDDLGKCTIFSAFASPPLLQERGGMDTGVLGRPKAWTAFKKIMGFIPQEFTKTNARNYYRIADKDTGIMPGKNLEINNILLNPENTRVHLPLAMNCEIKNQSVYKSSLEGMVNLVRAFYLESLLFTPVIAENSEKVITNCIEEMKQEIAGTGKVPCSFHIGSSIPKIGAAQARFHFKNEINGAMLKESLESWKNMFNSAQEIIDTGYAINDIFRLNDADRRVYLKMTQSFIKENPIPQKEVFLIQNELHMTPDQFQYSIQNLNDAGYLYWTPKKEMVLLEAIKKKN